MSDVYIDDDLKTRIAWLYYVEGMTQDEVAQRVGLTRARVLRMLANSRSDGTVQIRVTTKLTRCIELERKLEETWGLERAIVVPAPDDVSNLYRIIGRELGSYLSETVESNMSLGLGWGKTLTNGLPAIEPRDASQINVISLLGGLTRVSAVNPSEFAWRVADRLSAECYMMAAPVFAPDAETRLSLAGHPGISEVLKRAEALDMAVISLGDMAPNSILAQYDLLTSEELASLERAGAIGDILCHFVDAEGVPIEHPVNDRAISIGLDSLKKARRLVIASGGWNKVTVLLAALKALKPAVVITDETAAERLL